MSDRIFPFSARCDAALESCVWETGFWSKERPFLSTAFVLFSRNGRAKSEDSQHKIGGLQAVLHNLGRKALSFLQASFPK